MNRYFVILIVFFSSCASMKDVSVYNQEIVSAEGINGFTSIDIFSTGGTDEVWGNKDENCNPFSYSSLDASIDYTMISSKSNDINNKVEIDVSIDLPAVKVKDRKGITPNSLHLISDNSPSCEWIGMGIGWDSWQAKDLSSIINNTAIEFYARVDGDSVYNIPIVFILEDYSANQCYATAGYLGIDGGVITNKWTKVTIPLQTFSYQINKIDLTNVKQLLLQCYDKVNIYIDDIKIVPHQHNFKKRTPSLTIKESILPVEIFSEKLNASWGINAKYCDNIIINTDSSYSQGSFIDINMDKSSCTWDAFAISWNNWLYTDLTNIIYGVSLEFDIFCKEYKETKISIEDYDGKKMTILLDKYIKNASNYKKLAWNKVKIPLIDFPIRKSDIDLERIKDIIFTFDDKTSMKIDNIKLTN
jgi:hypothetical protein